MSFWKIGFFLCMLMVVSLSLLNQFNYCPIILTELSKGYSITVSPNNDSQNTHDTDGIPKKSFKYDLIQKSRIIRLNRECHRYRSRIFLWRSEPNFHLFLMEPQTGLAYCHVPKVASSFWYSVFSHVIPDVPRDLNSSNLHSTMLALSKDVDDLPENAFKMIFVRHPLKRLVSAYVEKFVKTKEDQFIQPTLEFIQKRHAKNSRTLKVNFPNFVEFVIHEIQGKHLSFGTHHWIPYTSLCRICETRFKFIGHLETLDEDAEVLIELFPQLQDFIPINQNTVDHQMEYNRGLKNNDNQTTDYLSQLDNETRNELLQIYKIDCKLFGYDCNEFWS